jgi:hypothetical protein
MGWSGYGIYDGDDTQTRHYAFLKWAKVSKDDEEICEWFSYRKTKIPNEKRNIISDNIDLILKKMPKITDRHGNVNEDSAIEWQMLAALFLDNKLKVPEKVYEMAKVGTNFLMGEHASYFKIPYLRIKKLRYFISKLDKNREI